MTKQDDEKKMEEKVAWPKWLPRYKDFIEIIVLLVGAGVAVATILSISDQIESLNVQSKAIAGQSSALMEQVAALTDQTDAMRKYIDAIREQTEAVQVQGKIMRKQVDVAEFQARPVVSLKPFEQSDILPVREKLVTISTGEEIQGDSTEHFELHFTVLTDGKGPVTIDSAQLTGMDSCGSTRFLLKGQILSLAGTNINPDHGSDATLPFAIRKSCITLFLIDILYEWPTASGSTQSAHLKRHGFVVFKDKAWHYYLVSPVEFEDVIRKFKQQANEH
jgi:hypothetical protein